MWAFAVEIQSLPWKEEQINVKIICVKSINRCGVLNEGQVLHSWLLSGWFNQQQCLQRDLLDGVPSPELTSRVTQPPKSTHRFTKNYDIRTHKLVAQSKVNWGKAPSRKCHILFLLSPPTPREFYFAVVKYTYRYM